MPDIIASEQKTFRHGHNLRLERFAESLFGKRYRKSADRVDIGFWKKFYIDTLMVLDTSIFRSIGHIDEVHRDAIQSEISHTLSALQTVKEKDEVNSWLIVGLLNLVFLLLGRTPYKARGKFRALATFRTLTYSQTEEQLSWLLQGYMQRNATEYGFGDHFEADFAFCEWTKQNKKQQSNRSAYVEWIRQQFPDVYLKFK